MPINVQFLSFRKNMWDVSGIIQREILSMQCGACVLKWWDVEILKNIRWGFSGEFSCWEQEVNQVIVSPRMKDDQTVEKLLNVYNMIISSTKYVVPAVCSDLCADWTCCLLWVIARSNVLKQLQRPFFCRDGLRFLSDKGEHLLHRP